jgi:hypothetical protein
MSIKTLVARAGDVVTLERKEDTEDTGLGVTQGVWLPQAGTVDVLAHFQSANTALQERYAARNLEVTHRVYITQDIGAVSGDRLHRVNRGRNIDRYYVVEGYREVGFGGRFWYVDVRETK